LCGDICNEMAWGIVPPPHLKLSCVWARMPKKGSQFNATGNPPPHAAIN
jgi:hypothetical protein